MVAKMVFVFGSKFISALPDSFTRKIDEYISEGVQFLIGDCDGVDTAVQRYLYEKQYSNVWIHASYNPAEGEEKKVRNNIGNWQVHYIVSIYSPGSYDYRRDKDLAMIKECDEGLGLWDGISRGTYNNWMDLIGIYRKPCCLKKFDDIEKLERHTITNDNKNRKLSGLATGFTDLDNLTDGLKSGDLIVVAGRPSMGKTTFVLNFAWHICFKENKNVAFFSMVESKEQLIQRMTSLGADAANYPNLLIDDTPGILLKELREKCLQNQMEQGLDLIIIDYFELMSAGEYNLESRQQKLSDIGHGLKKLAKEFNVPIIVVCQIWKGVNYRANHRPMLQDLLRSSSIELVADVVLFLYRDDYYNENSEKKGIAEVIVAKQRGGPVGIVELAWREEYQGFANLSK